MVGPKLQSVLFGQTGEFAATADAPLGDHLQIISLAAKHCSPALHEWRKNVTEGGLVACVNSLPGLYQHMVFHVDRQCNGARGADLRVDEVIR